MKHHRHLRPAWPFAVALFGAALGGCQSDVEFLQPIQRLITADATVCEQALAPTSPPAWTTTPSHAADVQEARDRGLTLEECASLTGRAIEATAAPSQPNPYSLLSENEVCGGAVSRDSSKPLQWDLGVSGSPYVEEAERRGLTLRTCGDLLGRGVQAETRPSEPPPSPSPAAAIAEPAAPKAAVSSPLIEEIQEALVQLGYHPGKVDGIPGRRTRSAIRAFQRDNGGPVDGQGTASVLARLQEAVARQAEIPAPAIARIEPPEDAGTPAVIAPEVPDGGEDGAAGADDKTGEAVLGSDVDEVKWFREPAEQGDAAAQYWLGYMYWKGDGVPKDAAEAVKWFRAAAEQGDGDAQYRLAYMYRNGEGVAKNGAEAATWFRKSAEQGNPAAQHRLGDLYRRGAGVVRNDAAAVKWFGKSAEQGNPDAQYNLGFMYSEGRGVRKDLAEAVDWFRKSAEQGDADAQYRLGGMLARGMGVERNYAAAAGWLRKSAEQGNAAAQHDLGLMYAKETGVPRDRVLAYMWLRLAAMQGFEESKKNLDIVAGEMTPAQIEEARGRAGKWMEK